MEEVNIDLMTEFQKNCPPELEGLQIEYKNEIIIGFGMMNTPIRFAKIENGVFFELDYDLVINLYKEYCLTH